jgi:hypothetical protein
MNELDRKSADEGDWCQFLELMEIASVKIERIYSVKLNRYDVPTGDLILRVSLKGVTYVTQLHEWTIENRRVGSFQIAQVMLRCYLERP